MGSLNTDLQKFEFVNQCETIKGLENAILFCADDEGLIQGRRSKFNAKEMASKVRGVVEGKLQLNELTRNYNIRQQALYIKHLLPFSKTKGETEEGESWIDNHFNDSKE